ncbi:cilia- and flagella-associated protein 54 isoform X2 [Oryzias melastigma]|uniref:cilia- and flagella-associated protein 54 isoform X2 n=1 Tax=Oryzias melastigma TaxID=30732 RepID=UPI000CF7F18C|nr:cilia- and flagella-associated protein 54 isoform X2 [Oryzias melastigma]
MNFPASHYGDLDDRNPVLIAFRRDIKSLVSLMKRPDGGAQVKGVRLLVEIWKQYKHRLPAKCYQDQMLQTADFLSEIKMHEVALWQGYSLHLQQFSSEEITDISDLEHFHACFFPEGLDVDQDVVSMKVRAMLGCALCTFELEKKHGVLKQKGLCKLLRVLSFIRIMMQAFQQHDHLSWHIYNGSSLIYNICRYLMTMNCSAEALEYLLWASISVELSVPLMTAKYLPLSVTLYCAGCYCYYDNQAAAQAEEFARRALGKINERAEEEEQSDTATSTEAQRAYKEASIKLSSLVFKRAVFEGRRPKYKTRIQSKSSLKDFASGPRPRTSTEKLLTSMFDSTAGQFLGILEALWDSSTRPLQTRILGDVELQEIALELLSAGVRILSGSPGEQKCEEHLVLNPIILTPTSTLIELAVTGEHRIPITSAVRFLKLLFQYKQLDVFADLSKQMLHILSDVKGQAFRKAERELALLHSYSSLFFQKGRLRDHISDVRSKSSVFLTDEISALVNTLQMSICGADPELHPDVDLVLDVILFLWNQVKMVMQNDQLQASEFSQCEQRTDSYHKWLWCLSVLCEVALACPLATVNCTMTAEMICTLAIQLEKASGSTRGPVFGSMEMTNAQLLQRVHDMVKKGLLSLSKGVSALIPQDLSAVTDSAFFQKLGPLHPPSASAEEIKRMNENRWKNTEGEEPEVEFEPSTNVFLLARDLHLELEIILHRVSVKLLHLHSVEKPELMDWIKNNKVSKALFLIQKALLEHDSEMMTDSNTTTNLLEEAFSLMEKAELEEKKLYMTLCQTKQKPHQEGKAPKPKGESPPPAPVLLSRTDHTFTFAPAPYDLGEQVCWYQLFGRVAEGINKTVRLNDCILPGTGLMVLVGSGGCVMRVEGLQPNQKYVFAVAAYDSEGRLLGNSIGQTTVPLLASVPVQLLATWAHLAQAAFQTNQYAAAKRACRKLWSHYIHPSSKSSSLWDRLTATSLHKATIQQSSPHLCNLVLTSIFIETEISIQEGALRCETLSNSSPFVWDQDARLAECDRMLVAIDLALCLNDGSSAVQAVVTCYGLLAPLMFHQIIHGNVVQVLQKCLLVLEENSGVLIHSWTGATTESLLYMTACITFYLSKVLRLLRKHQLAAAVLDRGRRLLQEATDARLQMSKHSSKAKTTGADGTVSDSVMIRRQFQALNTKQRRSRSTCEAEVTSGNCPPAPTVPEDPMVLCDLIYSCTLQEAHQEVMKIKWKTYFLEFAALFLQRTLEEGHPDLVLKWGENILQFLFRRDEMMGLSSKHLEAKNSKGGAETDTPQQNKMSVPHEELRKKLKKKLPCSMMRHVKTYRELCTVDNLLTMMSDVVRRSKKRLQLRNLCWEERPWRCQVHRCMAQAHLAAAHRDMETLQHSYSQFDPLYFSLAFTGLLIKKRPSSRHKSEGIPCPSDLGEQEEKREKKVRFDTSGERCVEGGRFSPTVDLQIDRNSPVNSLKLAASHLRRSMVLAHRGGDWTLLLCVCHTVWSHSCKITSQLEAPPPFTEDQLQHIFTPLLVLATDLVMDMLNKLELWSLYDRDSTEEELESSVHFSAPLDDGSQVDLRWVRSLVLHTLERLHSCEKWESLSHFALLFNSYTRERYALIVAPLLLHAQRSLIERIRSVGGPAIPQPHHVKTQQSTGKEVTNRSYFHCQLLSGWSPSELPIDEDTSHTNVFPRDGASLKAAEKQRSLSLVCVPLDVEDTLSGYHRALQKTPHCLQVLQHSRSLLLLLLANTQPYLTQLQSAGRVSCSPVVKPTPNIRPCEPSGEDFSTPDAIFGLPVRPDCIPTVVASYSNSIKCLRASGHKSLSLLALRDMGNLHFYAGNVQAAQSCWIQAVDCALQSSGVVQKWDGVSFGGGSMPKTVKHAGVWGCLQAAVIAAKIAQFILTSDINQRTKCCLLSSHLFKCVLGCSMAQPQLDLQYASHTIREELLPGVDLFSEPRRLHVSSVVSSLHFVCRWLFMTGHHITLLPLLALYLHFVGPVCRDVRRTVEGKILKVRVLTELRMFSEAVMEVIQLTQGAGIFLPCGPFMAKTDLQPMATFYNNKSLLDNKEAVETLMNCDFAPEIQTMYGPSLCTSFSLARVQLVLALSETLRGLPDPDPKDSHATILVESESSVKERADEEPKPPKQKTFLLCHEESQLTSERIKIVLLEAASSLLTSTTEQLASLPCSEEEKLELTVESSLLKANLHLQQGRPKLSFDAAVSSLVLLQTSPVTIGASNSELTEVLQDPVMDTQPRDCPGAAEAAERIGPSLWLRCRLALVQSLVASIHTDATLLPGKNINEETARLLQEGIEECVGWGDRDTQALLLMESAELEALRGKTQESVAVLQEAVALLSEPACMPPGSMLTLARAALLLNDIQEHQSSSLLQVTRKLLDMQMRLFGQSVDDKVGVCPPGSDNIYLPYITMLKEITLRIDSMENSDNKDQPTSSVGGQTLHLI